MITAIELIRIFFFFIALMGVAELAKGIQYEDPIKTGYVVQCALIVCLLLLSALLMLYEWL